jgi:hypothetical protein
MEMSAERNASAAFTATERKQVDPGVFLAVAL